MPHIYKIHAMADGSITSSATSNPSGSPLLLRWVMPSIADLFFLAILGTLVLTPLSIKLLNDAGTGWHVRTGQLIVANRQIPRFDPFSSHFDLPWFAWEWLYDVIVGLLNTSSGLNGVVWLTAVIIATVFAWTFRFLLARSTNLLNAFVLTLIVIGASMIHFLARPHVLSWLFAVAWIWILEPAELGDRHRKLWLLPILMILWVNLHGGFLLGLVLLFIYWIDAVWTWWRLNESRIEESLQKIAAGKRSLDLFFVGLVSLAASLVNPYGWKLHEHIYGYLTNGFLMSHIDEFRSPNFHDIAPKCFLVLLLIAVAVFAGKRPQLKLSHSLLAIFAVYTALYSARNIPTSSIFLVAVIGPKLPSWHRLHFFDRMRVVDSGLRGHLWPIAAIIATIVIALNGGRAGSRRFMDAHFDPHRMPVGAVNYLESTGTRAPILSPDYWGGYFIYRLYPHNRVVIDDRHDFYTQEDIYGGQFLKSYLTMMHVEPGWEKFLNWNDDCVVMPRRSPLAAVMGKMSEWKAVYADDVTVVFVLAVPREDSDRAP